MYQESAEDVNGDAPKNSTYRVGKRHKPFAQLANTMLRNSKLSLDERGALGYMLSHQEGWQFTFSRLCRDCGGVGRDKMRRILKSLEQHGYLIREKYRKEDGTFAYIYTVTDEPEQSASGGLPVTGSPAVDQPGVGKPSVAQPPAANQVHKNTYQKNTESKNTESKQTTTTAGALESAPPVDEGSFKSKIHKSTLYRPDLEPAARQDWVDHLAWQYAISYPDKKPRTGEFERAEEQLAFADRILAADQGGLIDQRCFTGDGMVDLLFVLCWDLGVEIAEPPVMKMIVRENKKFGNSMKGKITSWSYFEAAVEEYFEAMPEDHQGWTDEEIANEPERQAIFRELYGNR